MKRTGYLTTVCLAFVLYMHGQNKTIQITDLYGNWTLDLNEYEVADDEYILKRQKATKNQKEATNIIISLLAFDECTVYYDGDYYCGSGTPNDYSWAYNEDLQIINIYKSGKWLKYFKEENPEEFKKLELPEKYDEMELSLLQLKNGNIGLEIINWE